MLNSSELLFVVNEHNVPLEGQKRSLVHSEGLWHRVAHIWLINSQDEILCQKRSLQKDTNPGFWEGFFGGHIGVDLQAHDVAQLELEEELGIKVRSSEFKQAFPPYKYQTADGKNREFQYVYVLHWNGDISTLKIEQDEVEEIAWKTQEQVLKGINGESGEQWTLLGYEEKLLKSLN